jgi:ribose 5-phosphate isomerase B
MKIVIGNDHGAVDLKKQIVAHLTSHGHQVTNLGTDTVESCDYPDVAERAAAEYKKGGYDFGILLCGTGIGISISANKIDGIRCALPQNIFAAKMAKAHNDVNFIAFGGRIKYQENVLDMVDTFIETKFEGGRHALRVDKIMGLEQKHGK